MDSDCRICDKKIDDDDYYLCDVCGGKMHHKCTRISPTEVKCMILKTKRVLMLMCNNCKNVSKKMNMMMNVFEEMKEHMEEIKKFMDQMKKNNENTSCNELKEMKRTTTYSEMAAKQTKNVLIVKPTEKSDYDIVKKDVVAKVNPVGLKTNINMGKSLKNGGIVLEYEDKDRPLKDEIQKSLGEKYIVSEPKKFIPKLKIVNIPKYIDRDAEEIKEKIILQNRINAKLEHFHFKIVHMSKEFKGKYSVLIETDFNTFNLLVNKEKVNISLYECPVYEFSKIIKCYNCSGYNHISKDCTVERACPRCSKNHQQNDCKEDRFRCINCIKANKKYNLNLDVEHAAWDRRCSCLLKVEKIVKDKTQYVDSSI